MAVGAVVTAAQVNNILTSLANRTQDVMADVVKLWDWISTLGADQAAQEAGLVAAGFTSGEAHIFWTKANNMFAVASVYYGNITQPSAFDYDNSLAVIRGPA